MLMLSKYYNAGVQVQFPMAGSRFLLETFVGMQVLECIIEIVTLLRSKI